jgi:hypothetical protein
MTIVRSASTASIGLHQVPEGIPAHNLSLRATVMVFVPVAWPMWLATGVP